MRALCSGLSFWRFAIFFLLQLKHLRRKNDGLRMKQLEHAEWNSVANHPTGLGKERVREEVEMAEAQATSVELQWEEGETLSKQMCLKRWAKQEH